MQGLGVSIAKRVNLVSGRRGPVFDDRFFSRLLRTPREVANAVDYVLGNTGVHLQRMGVFDVPDPAVDPFSSAGCPSDPPVTSPPRTWLLDVGWRRAKGMLATG